jgi:hypothetical protein
MNCATGISGQLEMPSQFRRHLIGIPGEDSFQSLTKPAVESGPARVRDAIVDDTLVNRVQKTVERGGQPARRSTNAEITQELFTSRHLLASSLDRFVRFSQHFCHE